jgi:hypothetical protein
MGFFCGGFVHSKALPLPKPVRDKIGGKMDIRTETLIHYNNGFMVS